MAAQAWSNAVTHAVSSFGAAVSRKLTAGGAEEQLKAPVEHLLTVLGERLGLERIVCHGEVRLAEFGVRPDIRVDVGGGLVGYVELKAPGRSIDPAAFRDREAVQFERLSLLPNVLYSNGREWTLRQLGKPERTACLNLPLVSAGTRLAPADGSFAALIRDFLCWAPDPPRDLLGLVRAVSGLCRLLYFEVRDTLAGEGPRARTRGSGSFRALAEDWRELLFADLNDDAFADQYAQTIIFSLLLARRDGISFENRSIDEIAKLLGKQHSLMGRALQLLTQQEIADLGLSVILDTLTTVIGAVDWAHVERHDDDAYIHLYETFLKQYDSDRRKATGSYYTPLEVVDSMVGLVETVLVDRLGQARGFASRDVTVVDPAMGTGTFLINILDRVAHDVEMREGAGAVGPALREYVHTQLYGMELQLGPYAVAELRHYDALHRHGTQPSENGLRLFVTDTLDPPDPVARQMGMWYAPILQSRIEAARFKSEVPVMVVLGNPPYGERPIGGGKWIEGDPPGRPRRARAPLDDFRAPGNGKHEYKLANAYVHFWRWATWKAFDAHEDHPAGVVAFITLSAYCTGQAFRGMREYLRRTCDAGWIIDLSPEGQRSAVSTRIFPDVQQEICIGIFIRTGAPDPRRPAHIRRLGIAGHRTAKLDALTRLSLDDYRWRDVPRGWQEPFVEAQSTAWLETPLLTDLMPWTAPGVKSNRNWVKAPSPEVLEQRWLRLVNAPMSQKNDLMKATDARHIATRFSGSGTHRAVLGKPLADETGRCLSPILFGNRSFDRQWLIPDHRLIDRPRAELWTSRGDQQVFATIPNTEPPQAGPGITFTALLPDTHHYSGRGGLVVPLYRDAKATTPNIRHKLLAALSGRLGREISAEDLLAYIAAIVGHSGYSERFATDLATPGIRVPLTACPDIWDAAVKIGREVIWLHTFGERFDVADEGRARSMIGHCSVTIPADRRPRIVRMIPDTPSQMPDRMRYEPTSETLHIGTGAIRPVPEAVIRYEVSGMKVLKHWFDYRKKKPAAKRTSELDSIIAESWTPAWTTELLNLITVLGRLIDLEPAQRDLLEQTVENVQITLDDLRDAGVVPVLQEPLFPPGP